MANVFVKEVRGVHIYVTDKGKFTATVDGAVVSGTLATVEKRINAGEVPHIVIQRRDYSRRWVQCTVVKGEMRGRDFIVTLGSGEKLCNRQTSMVYATPEQVAEQEALTAERASMYQRHRDEIARIDARIAAVGVQPFTASLYEKLVREAQAALAKKAKEPAKEAPSAAPAEPAPTTEGEPYYG